MAWIKKPGQENQAYEINSSILCKEVYQAGINIQKVAAWYLKVTQ
jgi:hypothetical protein